MSAGNPLVDRPVQSPVVAMVIDKTWNVPAEQRPKGWQKWDVKERDDQHPAVIPVEQPVGCAQPIPKVDPWLEIRAAVVQMLATGRSRITLILPPLERYADFQEKLESWEETSAFVWKTRADPHTDTVTATVCWRRDDKRHRNATQAPTAAETPTPAPHSEPAPTVEKTAAAADPTPLCACGRPYSHHGRCFARRAAHAAKLAEENPSKPVEKCAVEAPKPQQPVVVLPTQEDTEAFSKERLWPGPSTEGDPAALDEKRKLTRSAVATEPLSWIGRSPDEEELIKACIAYWEPEQELSDAQFDQALERLNELTHSVYLHREAKRRTDALLNAWMARNGLVEDLETDPECEVFVGDLWTSVHAEILSLLKGKQ